MNVERGSPNQRDRDLAEADAMVESETRHEPDTDASPPDEDAPPP